MCTPPYLLLFNGWQNRFLLFRHSSFFQKYLYSGGLQLPSPPLGLKSYFQPSRGGSIRLGFLLWTPPPQWPWHTLLWQSLLSWHLLCPLLSCPLLLLGGASGPGFWPSTNSSIYPSLSGLSPQWVLPFLQFSESSMGWVCLLLWLSLSFSRGILVSFSFLCCCFLYLSGTECGQIFHSFRPHQTPS